MSTQGSAPSVVLPEELQQAISIGSAKVSVLREEESKLAHSKVDLEKDIARLEIRRDEVITETRGLVDAKEEAEAELGKIEKKLEDAKVVYGTLDAELVIARKEISEARANTLAEGAKLSTIVAQAREAQVDLDARRDAVKALEDEIEARKARIQDALATL
jgi:chromosome segregation ATPase